MRTFMLIVSMTTFIFTGCHQQKKSESLVIEMTNPTDRYRIMQVLLSNVAN